MSSSTNPNNVTIYLVRHAQTSGNVDMKTVEGETDILTDLGKIQTNLLGMHLSNVKFDTIYCSDYLRALKTTEGLLAHSKTSKNVPIQLNKKLREVHFGIYESSSYEEVLAYCNSLNEPALQWKFPEGESFEEAGQRMLSFIEDISINALNQECPSIILVVSHSAAIVNCMNALYESRNIHGLIGWDQSRDLKLMGNTCFIKMEATSQSENLSDTQAEGFKIPLVFTIQEKNYSNHLSCIKYANTSSNGLTKFTKRNTVAKNYNQCVHQ